MTTDPNIADREARTSAVLVDRSSRVRLVATGPDRAKFLHNLTTQDVTHLPAGEGREAFVTNLQGKTLGYITILADDSALTIRTESDSLGLVLPHLRKYGVFDDVELVDATPETFEFHLTGPDAARVLDAAGVLDRPTVELRHQLVKLKNVDVQILCESPYGRAGWTLIGPRAEAEGVEATLRTAAAPAELRVVDPRALEALRIEAGVPASGRDVTADNLPQEVARDRQAISFVKGCYLGQETVARIDALGHVNRLLRGLIVPGTEPLPAGAILEADGKRVGAITSSASSPDRGRVVALGYVRTSHAKAGTIVRVSPAEDRGFEPVDAVVSDLPMPPRD